MFKKLRETLTGVKDAATKEQSDSDTNKDAVIEVSETKDSGNVGRTSAGDADTNSKSVKANKAKSDTASPPPSQSFGGHGKAAKVVADKSADKTAKADRSEADANITDAKSGQSEKKPGKKRGSHSSDHVDLSDPKPASTAKKAGEMELTEEQKASPMGLLMAATTKNPPVIGDLIEGPVIAIDKAAIYVDLAPFGTGIIYGREYIIARDVIKKINVGDVVAAKIVDNSHKEGYYELSLKEARQALIWSEAELAIKEKRVLDLPIKEANKGGLLIEWQGITGFLPASQLKAEHYPRVGDGDKDKILEELKKLVGTRLELSIITADPKEGKLIFSEKGSEHKEKEKIVSKYEIGDEVEGVATGVVDFGVFVKLEEGLEGLVHISEIDWGLVDDPRHFVKVGDKIKAKIIEIKDGKISLSIKQLRQNPWIDAGKKYKKDMAVSGVIIKFNKHGALASIEEGVAGLVHVSEFGSEEKLRKALELGKTYPFKISLFDAKEQKMALSFAGTKI